MKISTFPLLTAFILAGLPALARAQTEFSNTSSSQFIMDAVDKLAPDIENVALHLWDLSELSLFEIESTAYLQELLVDNGFEITDQGTAGVPTAFIAEYGSGTPVLGIMLEYDALPGLGNEVVPQQEAREDGTTAGHGCGHNLIGAGAYGAAIAIKNHMIERSIPGTLRVIGGAAEETEGAKVYMAREGLFDDIDAMLHWHPYNVASVMNYRTTAMSHMYVEFKGKTAHAGMAPWDGRSALDAAEIFLHSVNMMREHVRPTARIHYIIANGGVAPNVVPDKAVVRLTFRESDRSAVEDGVAWLKEMAEGAALATQTESLAVDYFGMYDLLPNTPLAERMQTYLELVGLPEYTAEEDNFAKGLQVSSGVDQTGMSETILAVPAEVNVGGSTDVGDVSWITPTMGLQYPTIPEGIGVHTWMATASHGSSIGLKAAIAAAKILALTGIDLLLDQTLLTLAKEDFAERTDGFVYKSPIPDIIREPVGLPDDMRSFGSVIDLKESIIKQAEDDFTYQGDK